MKTWINATIITLLIGIPAFFLGPIIWTPHPNVKPTPTQIPFFMFLSFVESLLLGAGIAFIFFAWPKLKEAQQQSKNMNISAFVALSWLLVSWWPHDNWHIHNGLDLEGLLLIDYIFHLSLIIASLVLVHYFMSELKFVPTLSKRQK